MFEYSYKPEPHLVLVDLCVQPDCGSMLDYAPKIERAANIYGFTFKAVSQPMIQSSEKCLMRHLIYCTAEPYTSDVVRKLGALLESYNTISVAFEYQNENDMLSFRSQIETDKKTYNGKINFLRPDEIVGSGCRVSIQKIVDNAICDTIRVKYNPSVLSETYTLPAAAEIFFHKASSIYEKFSLYHRASSDGYFALRHENGFLITATKTCKTEIDLSRISYVHSYDEESNELFYSGEFLPSSDAVEASIIFNSCPEVRSVIHSHASDLFTRNGFYRDKVLVPSLPYGEPLLGHEVSRVIKQNKTDFLIMAEHGELFFEYQNEEFGSIFENISMHCLSRNELAVGNFSH